MTSAEFTEKIKIGEARVLTLDNAKKMLGEKVKMMYLGYAGQNQPMEITIGKIVTEKEYYENEECAGYANRYEYWKAESPNKAKSAEKDLMIIDAEGKPTYIKCLHGNPFYDEPTFVCSDADREVYFIEK